MHDGDTWVVAGGGPDIWGRTDGFHFVCRPLIGDGRITALVARFEYGPVFFSKAGVHIRESLDPSAANVGLSLEQGDELQYLAAVHYRTASADTTTRAGFLDSVRTPMRICLVREGERFTGLVSGDGNEWDTVGVVDIPMPENVYIGLAVTSHDTTRLNTAVFEQVTVEPRTLE